MPSRGDTEKGRRLLAAMKADVEDPTPVEEKAGWSDSDLHELFEAWSFVRVWMFDGYYMRVRGEYSMTVPPGEKLDQGIVADAVQLVERMIARMGIPE
jgi:hypothetical protein